MSIKYYPVIAAITANILAQLLKPVFYYFKTGTKDMSYVFESGGFPSSHTSMVVALTFALGFSSDFSSDAFFISAIFSLAPGSPLHTMYSCTDIQTLLCMSFLIRKSSD